MTSRYSRRQPLPEGLGPGERDFFVELRRMVDAASLTYRELERKTSTVRTDAADPAFYSKSQWARWLNGQAMPPRWAVRLAHYRAGDHARAVTRYEQAADVFRESRQLPSSPLTPDPRLRTNEEIPNGCRYPPPAPRDPGPGSQRTEHRPSSGNPPAFSHPAGQLGRPASPDTVASLITARSACAGFGRAARAAQAGRSRLARP
jgi:hypothetical protein